MCPILKFKDKYLFFNTFLLVLQDFRQLLMNIEIHFTEIFSDENTRNLIDNY